MLHSSYGNLKVVGPCMTHAFAFVQAMALQCNRRVLALYFFSQPRSADTEVWQGQQTEVRDSVCRGHCNGALGLAICNRCGCSRLLVCFGFFRCRRSIRICNLLPLLFLVADAVQDGPHLLRSKTGHHGSCSCSLSRCCRKSFCF